jgi:hypothetical protein
VTARRGSLLACLSLAASVSAGQAQEQFIIEVYGHRTEPVGAWTLETHANYVARGTTGYDGTVAPTQHQARAALELSGGIFRRFDVAGYLLLARRPGLAPEYAGWAVRTRASAPESWRLPIGLALSAELGHLRPVYGDDDLTLEITPILGKELGPFELSVNPSLERGFRSAGPSEWELEPRARGVWALSSRVEVDLEYHAALGGLDHLEPIGQQRHILYPSVTLKLGDDIEWNLGAGFGLTAVGDRVALKTRLEMPLK